MKFFPLIWSALWRKRARTVLTMLSIMIAFALYGVLEGINQGFDSIVAELDANRLVTVNRVSFSEPLPLSYLNRIREVDGVRNVAHATFFGGYFQDARHPVNAFAASIDSFFAMNPDFRIEKAALEAMSRTRTGAVIGRPLAQRYGWKVGDRVPLKSSIWLRTDGSNTWELDIVGIYDAADRTAAMLANALWLNFEYLDAARAVRAGTVLQYSVQIDDPRRATAIASAIDARFANSTDETRTQTQKASAQAQLRQLADVGFIVNAVVGAVMFALLFVTANSLMESIRERIPELAVLKTLGFSDRRITALVLSEAFLIFTIAALAGLILAAVLMPAVGGPLGLREVPARVFVTGFALAMLLALLSAMRPVVRTARLRIVEALARG